MNWRTIIPDTFITGLVFMVIIAYLVPFHSCFTAYFPLHEIVYWGITGIFFLYGLKLNPKQIRQDIGNWKLHLLIQSTTFILFPLIILVFYPIFSNTSLEIIWLAVFFLAALPSTVSSSVVMVSMAKGNIPSAIFNASISGLIGLIATPLWMGVFLKTSDTGSSLIDMTQQLVLQILLPVTLGLVLNSFFGKWAQRHKATIGWFDKIVIFLIIYKSFSAAFTNNVFSQLPFSRLILLSIAMILLFFLVYSFISRISGNLHFPQQDRITALFCGSKKSLVHGSVFVTLLITDVSLQSLFLLPIMIYHAFQLFYTSYAAKKFASTNNTNKA
jgi:sodium/bile acid cotransporter 7